MSNAMHPGFGGYRRWQDIRCPRTGREAGIEFRAWEGKLRRRLSFLQIIARAALAGLAGGTALGFARVWGWL